MKSLISALVLTAASILPVSAGIHDFNPANTRPAATRTRAAVGQGECITTRDQSKLCYLKTSATNFSISILDVDYPAKPEVVQIDCSTGRWKAFGDLPEATLDLYLGPFCPTFG
jgi:hypothetical protein